MADITEHLQLRETLREFSDSYDSFQLKAIPDWVQNHHENADRTTDEPDNVKDPFKPLNKPSHFSPHYYQQNTGEIATPFIYNSPERLNSEQMRVNSEEDTNSANRPSKSRSHGRLSLDPNLEGSISDTSFTKNQSIPKNALRTNMSQFNYSNRPSNITLMSLREPEEQAMISPQIPEERPIEISHIAYDETTQGGLTNRGSRPSIINYTPTNENLTTPRRKKSGTSRPEISRDPSDHALLGEGERERRKSDDMKVIRSRQNSDKKQFIYEDDSQQVLVNDNLNMIFDIDDDDDFINQSLSNMPTLNRDLDPSLDNDNEEGQGEEAQTPEQEQVVEGVAAEPSHDDKQEEQDIVTFNVAKSPVKMTGKKGTNAYSKIDDAIGRVTTENADEDEIAKMKRFATLQEINLVQDDQDDLENKVSNALLFDGGAPPSSAMKKKKKASRFNLGFFKKQGDNRAGIPTLTQKKRVTNDILNLEKLGISQKKDAKGSVMQSSLTESQVHPMMKPPMTSKLMEAFENIQMHRLFKQNMEMFILLFNQDAERGINYLISNELIDESPEKTATVLLTTEGLNKDMIGKYLGSHKERNIKVLKAYCNALDFSGLEFDRALRLLLSRFKLPGEAWQIERIVQIFAEVYHADNPEIFQDSDTPYILSYSLLMLNTDAHSDHIPKNKKMTRVQFINNNINICKGISTEYLGKMYDNIARSKFETKTDYIEQIYTRLELDSKKNLLQGETIKKLMDTATEIMKGSLFIKYGRRGKPHERYVWISAAEDEILWKKPKQTDVQAKSISIHDITNCYVGSTATKVLRSNKVPQELDQVMFSIETPGRTLDLRAPDLATRARWEGYFRQVLLQRRQQEDELALKQRARLTKDRERISDIWKTDILPNFHYHWDYAKHKPRGLNEISPTQRKSRTAKIMALYKNNNKQHAQKKKPFSFKDLFVFKSRSDNASVVQKSSAKESELSKHTHEENDTEENELRILCHNKSLLLFHVWRLGIPDWLRKTIWPITVGNRLEITPVLYQMLVSQAKGFGQQPEKHTDMMNCQNLMASDLPETFWNLDYYKAPDRRQALVNIITAFICYRPDVGYVKGMSHIAALLLRFCPEYEAFECFVNVTHSHHFIAFFRGDMREIEWRIEFFNLYFSKELPLLYNHFRALDISSEMFLLDWFISLFSTSLTEIDIIARIWDCVLLDGEVFAIKTAIGILKYYDLELKMMGFDAATKFLKKPLKISNEKQLFDIIESLNIPSSEYLKNIERQTVAQINTHIHQALLIN